AASRRWLVCGSDAVPPKKELCNGRDDDCDGQLPGAGLAEPLATGDEADHDGDKYMACAGCSGLSLAGGLKGCGDCNDKDAAVYPGAAELCDNQDNACAGAGYVDGKDDCSV